MEIDDDRRVCPVCGEKISGRIDKKFCSDDCRSFYNNRLRRLEMSGVSRREVRDIRKSVMQLAKSDATFLLKIIAVVCRVCKILTTFVSL